MKSEKRSHPRLKPSNIKAEVFSTQSSAQELSLNAEIVDISQTGIRIKLKKPLDASLHEKLEITMVSPGSNTPFTVHGTLKHQHSDTEIGLHYTDHVNGSIDDMLFECVKINDSTLLIKSQ